MFFIEIWCSFSASSNFLNQSNTISFVISVIRAASIDCDRVFKYEWCLMNCYTQVLPIGSNSCSPLFELCGRRISFTISFINSCCARCPVAIKSVIHHASVFSCTIENNCCDSRASERDFPPWILYNKVDEDAWAAFATWYYILYKPDSRPVRASSTFCFDSAAFSLHWHDMKDKIENFCAFQLWLVLLYP